MERAMTVARLDRNAPTSWPEDPDLRLRFAIRHMVDAFNARDSESAYLWSVVGRLVNTGASEGSTVYRFDGQQLYEATLSEILGSLGVELTAPPTRPRRGKRAA